MYSWSWTMKTSVRKKSMESVPESESSEEDNQPNQSPVHSGLEDMDMESDNSQAEPSIGPPSPPTSDVVPPAVEPTPCTDLSAALGEKPSDNEIKVPELHDEIVTRWEFYLTKGVKKDERQKAMEKYPIPQNCQALTPPKVNDEVAECLNDSVTKKDYFLRSLQHQIAHGLTAIGGIMDTIIKDNPTSNQLSGLADAALLFSNVHNALSVFRKQNILPLLNADSRKVGLSSQLDAYLFGQKFGEAVKNKQTLKKTSEELKNKLPRLPRSGSTVLSTSSLKQPPPRPAPTTSSSRYLNSRRGRGTRA